jgi:hypothetical protein
MPIKPRPTGLMRRQPAAQLFDNVFNGDMPCQLAASLVMVLIDTQRCAKPVEHLDDLSGALLGEQIDLEIEMIAAVGDHPQAVLLQVSVKDQHV